VSVARAGGRSIHAIRGIPLITLSRFLFALLFGLLPGIACVAWLPMRTVGRTARLGAALALSPALGGTVLAAMMLGGIGARPAAQILLAGSALALFVAMLRARSRASTQVAPDSRVTWWFCAVFVGVTAAFPTFSEWWRLYSDAWTHAGIARAIEVFGVPPLDPGFAGVRLQYSWIYHAFVAGAHALTGVDRYVFMAMLESFALAALILSAGSLAFRIGAGSVRWTLALLLLGMNALFLLFAPVQILRALTGEVRGMAELARQYDVFPLEWDRTAVFLHSLWGQTFFLNKFMVATPLALALGAFVAWLASFRRWLADGSPSELILAALLTFAAGLMHPVVGLDIGATTGLLFLALALDRRRGRPLLGPVFRMGLAVLAGLLPVLLYTATILGGKGGTHHEFPIDLGPQKILGYVSCLALGLVFGVKPVLKMLRGSEVDRAWTLLLLAGVVVALFIRLPGPSAFFTIDKFSYLVWIPLALTAGPSFASFLRSRSRGARFALAVLIFLPVNGLVFASRVADPHNHVRQPWGREVYGWIRSHTPRDAVLVTPRGDWETAQFTGRDQYFSVGHASAQLGYDLREIEARSGLVARLFASGSLSTSDRERLRALRRPVYVVWTDFRDSLWLTTPGALARHELPLGPRPAFDPSLPLLFAANGQEVRGIEWENPGGRGSASGGRIVEPDSLAHHP
jgi:Domain of unknown function (DUF6798)